jgi:CHAT domain-containing protein
MVLQKSEASREKPTSIFLCAPVVFQNEGLVELPGSESEVKDISGIFSAKNLVAEVATRDRANERKVKTAKLKNFSYIHFATHGIVDEVNPDLSRVYLHESSPEEDGRLYAGEIYNLELNARLVTLSACQTGLGRISKGEGVIGLSRALAYAGSENIIVSFWSVADESTAALMKNFYNELISTSNENFSGALQRAKLNLISSKKFDSPYYWAPFILIGY